MAIEAPVSRYKRSNLKIYIAACGVAAAVLAYDGYLSKFFWSGRHSFYEKHMVDQGGKPDATMKFNRIIPPVLAAAGVILGFRLWRLRGRTIRAEADGLVLADGRKITYESIEKIDRTYFQSKGCFVISYKGESGREAECRLSNRDYDNLPVVLDELVARIS